MEIIFIPLVKVANFEFNTEIKNYLSLYSFVYSPPDKSTGWEAYSLPNEGIDIYVEKGMIISISCEKECILDSKNIIGMNINDFKSSYKIENIGKVDKIYLNDIEFQFVYDFDELGVQLWCKNDIIVTAFLSYNIED